jgi:putative restriction endonuclease
LDDLGVSASPIPRDAAFKAKILAAYSYRCAVTGLDIRVGGDTVGLDAAHIKWHQAGGPCAEPNGLALSVLHHKLFDRGLFTVSNDRRVLVSDQAHGSEGFVELLLRFHNQPIRPPIQPEHSPGPVFLAWHRQWVFRGRARP